MRRSHLAASAPPRKPAARLRTPAVAVVTCHKKVLACGDETRAQLHECLEASSRLWSDRLPELEGIVIDVSLLAIKVMALVAILAAGIVGGVFPLMADRHHAMRRFLSLGNALAGGIFLGVGFIRLLPEAGDALETVVAYPLAPLLAAIGVGRVAAHRSCRVRNHSPGRVTADRRGHASRSIPGCCSACWRSTPSSPAMPSGSSPSWPRSCWSRSVSCSTRGSAAFSLMVSVNAVRLGQEPLSGRVLTTFVVMTPLGIVLGLAASSLMVGRTAMLVTGSVNALAAGTFIYVAILDVIDSEMSRFDDRVAAIRTQHVDRGGRRADAVARYGPHVQVRAGPRRPLQRGDARNLDVAVPVPTAPAVSAATDARSA